MKLTLPRHPPAWVLALAASLFGCGNAPSSGTQAATPQPTDIRPAEAAPRSGAAPATPTSSEPAEPRAGAAQAQLVAWERRIPHPIASFALGKKRVAALGTADGRYGPAWILDQSQLVATPLPERLLASASQRDDLRVHFGRDDWPRILGARVQGDRASGVYLRHKGEWKREPNEILKLIQPPDAAFYGVIGHDDPEVVCEVGQSCIVKRVSGWTFVPASAERMLVELSSGVAWGVGANQLSRMTERGWERVGGNVPWTSPAGVWGNADGTELWVSEPATDSLHRWDGRAWTRHGSPVRGPQGLWGTATSDVWLAATGGVARWNGKEWQRVTAPEAPFQEVRGRGANEVWIGGPGGLWQGSR